MYGNNDYRDYIIASYESENHIEHFQRKGAHWGIMNGPPYPLNKEGLASFRANLESKIKKRADKKKMAKLRAAKEAKKIEAKKETERLEKENKKAKKFSITSGRTSRRDIKKLSDKEIQARIDRLNLEKKLRDLEKEDMSKGKQILENALTKAGEELLTSAFTKVGKYYIDQIFKEVTKEQNKNQDNKKQDNKKQDNKKQDEKNNNTTNTSNTTYNQYNFYGDYKKNQNKDVIDGTFREINSNRVTKKDKRFLIKKKR